MSTKILRHKSSVECILFVCRWRKHKLDFHECVFFVGYLSKQARKTSALNIATVLHGIFFWHHDLLPFHGRTFSHFIIIVNLSSSWSSLSSSQTSSSLSLRAGGTWICSCTTWPSFPLTSALLFIIATPKLVASLVLFMAIGFSNF